MKAINTVKSRRPGVLLKVIGSVAAVGRSCYRQIEDYIKKKDLARNIKFCGYMDAREVAQELSMSAMLILPSFHEPFGCVLAEAMAVGIPVVGTKVGGIPYIIRDNETGFLVEPGDAGALVEKMLILLEDKKLRREMGQKGREEAGRRFRPEIIAREMMAVYREILSRENRLYA